MKTELTVTTLAFLFAVAWIMSGRGANSLDRLHQRADARQIKVLEITSEYRLVRHFSGETRVPLAPRRIVSLTPYGTDILIALGIRPVAVGRWDRETKPHYLADRLKGLPVVVQSDIVNLEAVAGTRPDLILASGRWFEPLSRIAPTVILAGGITPRCENAVLDIGDAIGRFTRAEEIVADYRKKSEHARLVLAANVGSKPVAFLRFRSQTCAIYMQRHVVGPLLFEKLGLTPDAMVPKGEEGFSHLAMRILSLEQLSQLRAEYILYTVDRNGERYWRSLTQSPIWRAIPAVRHGHACRMNHNTFFGGDGVLACEAMIDETLAALSPERRNDADG